MSTQAYLAILIMMCFMPAPTFDDRIVDLVELFAGVARVSRLANARGWHCLCHDFLFDREAGTHRNNCMDINGAAGFVQLGMTLYSSPIPDTSSMLSFP